RRWRACAALQKATISAIVRGSDDRQTLEVAIIENLQR
ncbi:MAG: ParB N-terminal domain-containing protein, partial [Candidatus Eremiobacteraeota bacterium]|nr:ParB N-terminal domain-containing protein [Candidatus Eremiobacteraeota bacterium]